MYLVLFSILLYRTIVTVYTDYNFLYNYQRQMHQIIRLSPVGCFTPARGKSVQKNREVSWVKSPLLKAVNFFPCGLELEFCRRLLLCVSLETSYQLSYCIRPAKCTLPLPPLKIACRSGYVSLVVVVTFP